jgi:hypothetical protein
MGLMVRIAESRRHRALEARLRRQLRRKLRALDIEAPVSVRELARRMGTQQGKPIRLIEYPLPVPGPFGLWLSTPSADYVLYQAKTTADHQDQIIAHELGHLISGHASDEQDDAVWQQFMPDVPPEMVRRALRRTSYDTDTEREAETAATILLEAAAVIQLVALPGDSRRARQTQRALGDPQDWL